MITQKRPIAVVPAPHPVTRWLDGTMFPAIVSYVVHRAHIIALLLVGIALMISTDPLIQLKLGNYTNVCSALVSCIVLLQSMSHHRENLQHHRRHTRHLQHLHHRLIAMEQHQKAGNS
jgi:hypothetical protein